MEPPRTVKTVRVAITFVLVLALSGCGSGGRSDADRVSVRVFAAASLTDAFGEIAEAFEAANPDVAVDLNFAGSSSLREQVLAGAPADVFASADAANMDALDDAGLVDVPVAFASNTLQIAVPADNPARIAALEDLAEPDVLLGVCAPSVPCGALARSLFTAAGVAPSPVTEEADVRSLLTKVIAGELDAGMVYRTDVVAAGDDVIGIDVTTPGGLATTYPIAVVSATDHAPAAGRFIGFVVDDAGRAILDAHGFGPP